MNLNVTGDPTKDSYLIMVQSRRIETICDTLKKHATDSEDIRLILNLELALLDIKDCARSIYELYES